MPNRIKPIRKIPIEYPFSDPPYDLLQISDRRLSGGRESRHGEIEGWRTIADDNGNILTVVTTEGDRCNFFDIYESTMSSFIGQCSGSAVYASLYSYDIDILLKMLGNEVCEKLVYKNYAAIDGMRIWYRRGQAATIRTAEKTVRFVCLASWAPANNVNTLLDAAEINLVNTYESQAMAARSLSILISNRASKIYRFAPGDLKSPTAITNELLTATINEIGLETVPDEAQRMAYEGLHAPWIETMQRGSFPESWDYDLTSAYPQELKNLLDIGEEYGDWKFVNSFQPEAKYGFYRARINIPHDKHNLVTPIRFRVINTLYTVTGEWIGYINQQEIEFMQRHKLGSVEVLYGWTFFTVTERRPFQKVAVRMILMRSLAKTSEDNLMSAIIKNALVRITGKFLQRYQMPTGEWVTSSAFAPIYANIAMTNTKLRLAETLLKYSSNVISITTDGFLLDSPLQKKDVSEFRLEAENVPSVYLAPALFTIPGKSGRFDAKEIIESGDSEEGYLIVPYETVISLCDAIVSDKFSMAGTRIDSFTRYPMNDIKRVYQGYFFKAEKMLQESFRSRPYQVDQISIYNDAAEEGISIPRY